MIKITNGSRVLMVSSGAYRNYFKHLGYKPVEETQTHEKSDQENTHHTEETSSSEDSSESSESEETPVEEAEEEYEEDLSEIPLSEMKLSQLIAYAEQLGLEHDGSPTKKEMRALIREHLNQ